MVSQIKHYTTKFAMKMDGSLPSEAAEWIDGIHHTLLSDRDKLKVWDNIQEYLDKLSPDPQAHINPIPEWLIKIN